MCENCQPIGPYVNVDPSSGLEPPQKKTTKSIDSWVGRYSVQWASIQRMGALKVIRNVVICCLPCSYGRGKHHPYLNKYYDSHMCLLNRDGLTLVNKHWFEWAKRAMKFIRTECNEDRIKREGQHAFDKANTAVMTDSILRHEFICRCAITIMIQVKKYTCLFNNGWKEEEEYGWIHIRQEEESSYLFYQFR